MHDNIDTDEDELGAPCDDVPFWIQPQINDADAREGGECQ